jgi:hypothetical protein
MEGWQLSIIISRTADMTVIVPENNGQQQVNGTP